MERQTVAIVGSETLLAREIRELLNGQAPDVVVKLIGAGTETAILTEHAGEPVLIQAMDEEALLSAQVVCLTGSAEATARCLDILRGAASPPVIIDLSYGTEQDSDTRLTAPLAESPLPREEFSKLHIIAHPAAIVLAGFFRRLHDYGSVARSVVNVLEPASQSGKEAVKELQQQALQLLSFKSVTQDVFGAQIGFNILPRLSPEAAVNLVETEIRIQDHLTELLSRAGKLAIPSLRVAQAPVFHGHSISVWAEFDEAVNVSDVMKALASEQIEIRSRDDEPPTNVGAAGHSGMIAGCIEVDRNNPNAAWFWLAADSLRVSADNAVCLTRLMIPVEGHA